MDRHGQESYYIIGEGLVGETLGGRPRVLEAAAEAQIAPFRFSRMGPNGQGKQLGTPNRKKIALAMTVGELGEGQIPAGFTYLGQFIDHDLTFDKTTVTFGANISPADLIQGRSPTLDLDSLYGAGPSDPVSAKFYEADGLHLKMGKADGGPPDVGFDLHRKTNAKQAIIPDKRNDENLAVAQTHLAMIRFHNRVVDTQLGGVPAALKFATAREIVTKHYQWMIRHDYLPRICAAGAVTDVFKHKRKIFEKNAAPNSTPTMPVEFSIAAFRLGHSMVRAHYSWNRNFQPGAGDPGATLGQLFQFAGLGGDLGGGNALPSIWIADFRRLYDFREAGRNDLFVASKFNKAMRIDSKVVDALRQLPGGIAGGPPIEHNLPFRNLTRAAMVRLATGQQMATFVKNKGVQITKLTKQQIKNGNGGASLSSLNATQINALTTNTPLWFYILREAELNNGKLKGVGARIVVETLHRAMEGAKFSIVRDPTFKPTLGPNNTTFRMVDLLLFAFEGKASLLNPLG